VDCHATSDTTKILRYYLLARWRRLLAAVSPCSEYLYEGKADVVYLQVTLSHLSFLYRPIGQQEFCGVSLCPEVFKQAQ